MITPFVMQTPRESILTAQHQYRSQCRSHNKRQNSLVDLDQAWAEEGIGGDRVNVCVVSCPGQSSYGQAVEELRLAGEGSLERDGRLGDVDDVVGHDLNADGSVLLVNVGDEAERALLRLVVALGLRWVDGREAELGGDVLERQSLGEHGKDTSLIERDATCRLLQEVEGLRRARHDEVLEDGVESEVTCTRWYDGQQCFRQGVLLLSSVLTS